MMAKETDVIIANGCSTRTIVVGGDEPEVRRSLEVAVGLLGYTPELAEDGHEVLRCLKSAGPNVAAMLLGVMMPNQYLIETLKDIRRIYPDLPVIVFSSEDSATSVVRALKNNGATDFLCKPLVHEDLENAISRAVRATSALSFIPLSAGADPTTSVFHGASQQMREIHSLLGPIAWSEVPVLIQGETGTGKEVLAREIHARSPREGKPFLKLNCAALPAELIESELFGFERGSFTGAFQKKAGMFELADGGTVLLDEIGDMDIRLQAKLLRVLQDQKFHRIGGKETIHVDMRIIAATHRDLEKAIVNREFREDLYYRLNVITLNLPRLCERQEDIIPLAEFLMRKHSPGDSAPPRFPTDLKRAFMTYHWPGNIRELENVIRRFLVLGKPEIIAKELSLKSTQKPPLASPVTIEKPAAFAAAASAQGSPILEQVTEAKQHAEREAILAALDSTRWNRKQAADLLKVEYKALLYKMKKLGM